MAANELARLLDALPTSDNPLAKLEEIKAVTCSVHPSALMNIVGNVSFNIVFEFLNSQNGEQVELCCEVLEKLLTALGPEGVIQTFQTELSNGLHSDNVPTKCLCLKQLHCVAGESLDLLMRCDGIVHQLISLVADDTLEVAQLSLAVLACFGHTVDGLMALYSTQNLQSLQKAMDTNDSIRFRVYELLIKVSRQSLVALQHTEQSGLLQHLLNELHKDDILVQLNAIELLSDLSMTEHGLVYLDQQGIVGKLESMLGSVETDPMAGLLLPGLLKFFGGVARFHPKEICMENETFVRSVFDNLMSQSESDQSIAIQTIGFIGSTADGKQALEKLGSRMNSTVPVIGKLASDSRTELRITSLNCIQNLIKLRVDDQTVELLGLTEKWFSLLGPKTFETLLSIAQQPFTDLRCTAHQVLTSLATQPWGQRIMNSYPGFNEYLMDRLSENIKEGKQSKYDLIKALAESPTSMDIFGQPYYVKLKAYVLQGPFHVKVQAEVAIEGE